MWIGELEGIRRLDLVLYNEELPKNWKCSNSLSELHLWFPRKNSRQAIPSEIKKLQELRYLSISTSSNPIELPDWLHELPHLKKVNLRNCRICKIPYSLVKTGLRFIVENHRFHDYTSGIYLYGASLQEGDINLFSQPREVIEEYYRNRIEADEAANECKVIFLGDGEAGKSSLIERIMHDKFEDDSLPTDGVNMKKWSVYPNGELLTVDNKPLTIRFLDFGGQEIMHSMHRCFLTSHTVYVVVCESRDDAEIDSVAARWMETVQAFAPGCPIILALNKSDLNPHVTVNERTLKAINSAYRHMLHTSAKSGYGVEQLTEDILQEVPSCLQQMSGNKGFLGLKRELEDMDADYILPEQFRQRCNHFEIKESVREGLLNWFQDLGVAYSYKTMFQSIYVLNPAWLTNGIYRLILRTSYGGFLKHSTIRETLAQSYSGDISDKTYTAQEMEFILYVMRKFEISLRVTPEYAEDGIEMIPMKMEKTPPPRYDDFQKSGALHLRWEAGYLPNNLVHRLMIRKYPELDPDRDLYDKCVWRTGGWFRSMDRGCEALAEMTDKALDVYVRGERDARIYMDSFRQQVLHILEQLNIEAKEFIYCTIHGKTGRIPFEDVINLRNMGRNEVYLGDIVEFVSIEWLLRENYLDDNEQSVQDARDFFLSYNNGHDGLRASWIAKTLRENGYTVFFQEDDCKPGMNFPKWMAEAIAHSHGFLAVWSKDYEDSAYCQDELSAAYVRSHRDIRFLLLPLRVENVPIRNPLFDGVVHADLLNAEEEKNQEALLLAVEQIRQMWQ